MSVSAYVTDLRSKTKGLALGSVGLGGLYQNLPGGAVAVAIETFRCAFENGIRLIDTAPWYNNAEHVVGEALVALADTYNREDYYLVTKVGRYRSDKHKNGEFDYSRARIHRSVKESLQKLR
jgi:aryl-alcohol dehydrogenase-like predicted oxidoreductase